MNLDRRAFLTALAAAGAGAALPGGAASLLGKTSSPRNDLRFGLPERAFVIDSFGSVDPELLGDACRDLLNPGRLTAVHTSLANGNLEVARQALAEWQRRFDRYPRLMKVLAATDIERCRNEGKLGILLGFQNATCIDGNIENLYTLHAAGTRVIQLTYDSRNLLGDGCNESTNTGLSDFGVAVVETMNELGMVVDLSHCGEQTSRDGIQISRKPPAFTHTWCKTIYEHPRAKSDELLQAIAARGGMIGIAARDHATEPGAEGVFRHYLDHIDYAVKMAGIDHVGLASRGSMRSAEVSGSSVAHHQERGRFHDLARGLAGRGYHSDAIEKLMGGNWNHYLQQAL